MPVFSGDISGQRVSVELGDITSKKCDAYIVPQFNSRVSGGGVGGAIIRSGAKRGMSAYQNHLDKHDNKLNFGDACLSTSGGGKSKYLLHVVSVGSEKNEEFSTVQKATYNALLQAQKRGIKTIAAPALGTGTLGALTLAQSAKAMMSAISQFVKSGGKFDEINFIIYGSEADQKTFASVLANKSFENIIPEVGQKKFNLEEWSKKIGKDIQVNLAYRERS